MLIFNVYSWNADPELSHPYIFVFIKASENGF